MGSKKFSKTKTHKYNPHTQQKINKLNDELKYWNWILSGSWNELNMNWMNWMEQSKNLAIQ